MVHDALLALTPDLVQLVQEEVELRTHQLPLAFLDELPAKVVGLLWYPDQRLSDEIFVAGAEMELTLAGRCVETGLDPFQP